MNQNDFEQEERYYKQYNKDGAYPRDGEELQAFRIYTRMRHQIRYAKVPSFAHKSLVDCMVEKMEENTVRFPFFSAVYNRSRLVAAAYAGAVVVCLLLCANLLQSIDWGLAERIQFVSASNKELSVPAVWKYRLLSGRKVNVPAGVQAVLELSDGTTLDCAGESHISVEFDVVRTICLSSGKITVHAGKNPEWPLFVATPLGEVQVTGTVFTVELTQ